MKNSDIVKCGVEGDAVNILFEDGRNVTFEDFWLRDQCRCPKCFHADTNQRAVHILDIPEAKVADLDFAEEFLRIYWDDGHESKYEAGFLYKYNHKSWFEGKRLKPILWHGNKVANRVTHIHVTKFTQTTEGAKSVFQSLLDYGVAFIEGIPATLEDTETVVRALGGVQHTLYGGMWKVYSGIKDHADTAYGTLPLASHNDNTYFTEPAGLQIFHCLEHSQGVGGDTTLVDGFKGASRLKAEHPEDFDFLTRFHVEAEYIEEGHHHKYSAPVIRLDAETGDLQQIRFNVYDRSAMAFANGSQCRTFYRAYKNLARYLRDPSAAWQFKLTPGTVVAIDNFRVLHGRTAFNGLRVLCGAYVSRSDWLDKARALKLIQ